MKRLAVTGLVGLLGCASNQALDKKVSLLAAELATTRKELNQRFDDLARELAAANNLERKLDQLSKTLDTLAAAANRPAPPPRPRRPEPDRAVTYAVPIAGAASIGPADAKVTMIVGYDYACGYCEKVQPTLADLRKKYGPNLRMVFHHVVIHPRTAMAPALAACAADKQGKYAAMDARLWDAYRTRSFDADRCWESQDGCPIIEGHASSSGLDLTRFKADLRACQPTISAGMRDLGVFGVAATPSFFINGRYISGAQPIESFSALIDEELAKADGRIRAGTPKRGYYQKWVLDAGLKQLAPPPATTPEMP